MFDVTDPVMEMVNLSKLAVCGNSGSVREFDKMWLERVGEGMI